MLVPSEQNYAAAIAKVEQAGFSNTSWSYGSLDPAEMDAHTQSERLREIHSTADQHYKMLNMHSKRYTFPAGKFPSLRALFVSSSYVELSPPSPSTLDGPSACQDSSSAFTRQGIFYYPLVSTLLESVIRVMLKDKAKTWNRVLFVWITCYICVYLPVGPDAVDICGDENVKEAFSKLVRNPFVTRWDQSRSP